MLVHALRGSGADPSLPGRRRGALDGRQRRLGDGGVARGRGRRVRPLAAQARTAGSRSSPTPSSTTTRPTARSRDVDDDVPRVPGAARATRSCGSGRSCWRWRTAARACGPSRSTPVLSPGGSRFALDGVAVELTVPGAHNARNAAAALTAMPGVGGDVAAAAAALRDFAGAGRRFERLGTTAGGRARGRRLRAPPDRGAGHDRGRPHARARGGVVAVFQPHLYSRTQHQAREFGAALAARRPRRSCSTIYPARERAEDFPGVTGRLVAEAAADAGGGKRVAWLPDFDAAERFLRAELREGDLLLTLGAGDVDALGRACGQEAGRCRGRSSAGGRRPDRPHRSPARAASAGLRCSRSALGSAAGCGCATPPSSQVRDVHVTGARAPPRRPRPRRARGRRARHDHAARPRGRAARGRGAVPLGRRPARPTPTSRTADASRCSSARPVAALETGAGRVAAAGDGRVLRGVNASRPADPARPQRRPPASA